MSAADGTLPPDAAAVIEDYLDVLARRVGLVDRESRRLLSETSDHLVESALDRIAAGGDPIPAAVAAIRAFGEPEDIAAADRAGLLPSPGLVVRQGVDLVLRVGIVGGLCLGASGLLAWLAGTLVGMAFVSGDGVGITYTPERCAQYIALFPERLSCTDAALLDHYGEVIDGRIVLGVLAAVVGVVWLAWRRRPSYRAAPAALVGAVGLSLSGLAFIGLVLWSLNLTMIGARNGSMSGVGAPLSAAIAALAAMLVFLPAVVRVLRTGRLPGSQRRGFVS